MSFQGSTISMAIAKALLDTKAIILSPDDPFTWTSGWKSPIYCDNRKTLSFPESREVITNALIEVIKEKFSTVEMIAGVATAGIPQAAIIADRLCLPMVYIRDKAKGHGRQNQIEGHFKGGEKTVVIEDLFSTGGSSLKAALALQEAGMEIQGVMATFSYGFETAERSFEEVNMKAIPLCTYTDLLPIALERGIIQENQLALLQKWREDPGNWKG